MNKKLVLLFTVGSLMQCINAMQKKSLLESPPQRAMWAFADGKLTDNDSGFEQYSSDKTFAKLPLLKKEHFYMNPVCALVIIRTSFLDSQTGNVISQKPPYFRTYTPLSHYHL